MRDPVFHKTNMKSFFGVLKPLLHQFFTDALVTAVGVHDQSSKLAGQIPEFTQIEDHRCSSQNFVRAFFFGDEIFVGSDAVDRVHRS